MGVIAVTRYNPIFYIIHWVENYVNKDAFLYEFNKIYVTYFEWTISFGV